MQRRAFCFALAALAIAGDTAAVEFARVRRGLKLRFPFDHGAHPDFRNEWWYATGWLDVADGGKIGFQSTFFRVRTGIGEDNASAFAPRQLLLAHAAIADPRLGALRVNQRAARVGFGRAGFASGRTDVWIGDWHIDQRGDRYRIDVQADEFAYALTLVPDGPPLLNGVAGFSAKAADEEHASYYYSRPQLIVRGTANGLPVTGTAWLDHEWSSQYMAAGASGWDWCGLNLDGGEALMAFRMRGKEGAVAFAPPGVGFEPLRTWKSPRTGTVYPVSVLVRAREQEYRLEPLMDDQELDARASTGTIYWEGAVRAFRADRQVGRGYLELTGYWRPMSI